MRVLQILTSNKFSGAEKVAIKIIQNLDQYFDFAYASPKGSISSTLMDKDISYIEMKQFNLKEVKRVIKSFKPDIIHAHDFTASVYSAIACLNKDIKVISHLHNNALWINKVSKNTISYLLSTFKYNKIICVSSSIKNEFLLNKFFFKKADILHNIVDINEIIALSKRETISDYYDIGFVGRLADPKNPLRFIKIIKEIKKEKNNIKAFMIGDGPLYENCIDLIVKLGLEENLALIGFKNNPYPYVTNCKLMIVPSKFEGFGLVAVESLALGKPVLVSNTGGLPNIVNENCGKVCKSDQEFIQSALMLLNDTNLYKSKRENCYHRALEFGDLDTYYSYFRTIYQ